MANFFRSVLLRLQNKTVTADTSAFSITKDSGYDGLGTVTINPTPSETKTQAAGTSNIDVTPTSGKLLSKVTVTPTPTETKSATPSTTTQTITPSSGKYLSSVSVGAIPTETKSQAAGTSNIDVTPTSGKYLTKVTITPQQHSDSFTPTANLKGASGNANDMGLVHNKRFVDTSGMIVPSGNKAISANGTGIDVTSYSTVSVSVPNPTLSGDADEANVLANKTFYKNSYTKKTGTMANNGAFEGDVDPSVSTPYELSPGYYSSIEISVLPHTEYSPSSSTYTHLAMGESKSIDLGQYHKYRYVRVDADAPSGNKSITANGTGIDVASYSTVSVSVPHPTHTTSFTPTANLKGAAGNANDMGTTHSHRYVDTTGMIVPSGNKSITANGTGIDVKNYATASVSVSGTSIAPSDSSPVAMTSGTLYTPTKAGYAIESNPTSLAPSDSSPATITSGKIYKTTSSGYAIKNYSTITPTNRDPIPPLSNNSFYKINGSYGGYAIRDYGEITPSNSNPPLMDSTLSYNFYKIPDGTTGYAIASYQSKTPSASGTQFDEGFVNMSDGGYAYSSKPTPQLKRTTLWTNSAPTTAFGGKSVTLSQSIRNFDYIEVSWRSFTSQTNISSTIMSVDEFVAHTSSTYNYCRLGTVNYTSSSESFHRSCAYESDTSVKIATGSSTGRCIPQYIYGLKLSI